jgi:phosphatidyl-myo-inositol dimannoside synthase
VAGSTRAGDEWLWVGAALGISSGDGLSKAMAETRLRILALVTDAFGGHGGIAQYNRDLLLALAACEDVGDVIVVPRAGGAPLCSLPPEIRLLPSVNSRIAYSLAAGRAGRAHGPIDIVFCGHAFMAPLAALLAKALRARLWVQVHGIEAWQELSALYQRSIESADLITSVSRHTRRRLLQWCGIDPSRVKVLPNMVDRRFSPGPKPQYLMERHQVRGRKVLLTVSRLAAGERYKGHDRIIRLLPRVLVSHPETIYLVVGDGDDRPRLEALGAEMGVTHAVRFVGRAPSEELPDYFRLADVFVMPSTGEGFGIVFLEAMACGIRTIGGNVDGSVDSLGNDSLARAVDPNDGNELISAICAALESPVLHDGNNNKKTDTRLDRTHFAEHLHGIVTCVFGR